MLIQPTLVSRPGWPVVQAYLYLYRQLQYMLAAASTLLGSTPTSHDDDCALEEQYKVRTQTTRLIAATIVRKLNCLIP